MFTVLICFRTDVIVELFGYLRIMEVGYGVVSVRKEHVRNKNIHRRNAVPTVGTIYLNRLA